MLARLGLNSSKSQLPRVHFKIRAGSAASEQGSDCETLARNVLLKNTKVENVAKAHFLSKAALGFIYC